MPLSGGPGTYHGDREDKTMATGSIHKRYEDSWSIIIDHGYITDPETGKKKRKQKWHSFKGIKRDAKTKLDELLYQANNGMLVDIHKITFGEWLAEWLELSIKPRRTPRTYKQYKSTIEAHLKPKLGNVPLKNLRYGHIEKYYQDSGLKPSSLQLHHAIIAGALKAAERKNYVVRNEARLVENRPSVSGDNKGAIALALR